MKKLDSLDIFGLKRIIQDIPGVPGTFLSMLCLGAENLLTKDEMFDYKDFPVVLFASLNWFFGVRSQPENELDRGKQNYVMSFVSDFMPKYPMDEIVSMILVSIELSFHMDLSLFHQMYGIPPEKLDNYFKTISQETDDLMPLEPIPILYDIPEIKS